MVSKKAWTAAAARLLPGLQILKQEGNPATTFEAWTVLAAEIFRQAGVNLGIAEVGMGGRLDATSVWDRLVLTVLTNIDLEHTQELGPTRDAICRQKLDIGPHSHC